MNLEKILNFEEVAILKDGKHLIMVLEIEIAMKIHLIIFSRYLIQIIVKICRIINQIKIKVEKKLKRLFKNLN